MVMRDSGLTVQLRISQRMATHEQLSSTMLLIFLVHILLQSLCVCGNDCEIEVSSPWKEKTFIPQGSSALISCTDDTSSESDIENLEWSIRLPDREIEDDFVNIQKKKILNDRGFYELPPTAEATRLHINSTDGIDGTVLKCADILSGQLLQKTTLLVREPILIKIGQVKDLAVRSVNLTWTSPEAQELIEQSIKLNYSLKVTSKSDTTPIQVQEPFYIFTAPEGAPPCEVYNFSVTATYVGATYTGTACSIPSPVISRMLPSLPDIIRLESTLMIKHSTLADSDGVTLIVSFMPASYCDSYPVTVYSLRVVGKTSSSPIVQASTRNSISVNNLFDNEIYTFNVIVSNIVGNVSTSNRKIYTTDVQKIIVVPLEESNAFAVQCIFLSGSIAQGCKVILMGEFDSITVNLTKNGLCAADTIEANLPVSNYSAVFGHDIESDGSVGTLAVHGIILRNASGIARCMPSGLTPNPTTPFSSWLIGVISGVSLLAAIFVVMFCIVICCICKKRYKIASDTEHYLHVSRPPMPNTPPLIPCQQLACVEQDQSVRAITPVYDLPEKYNTEHEMDVRSSGDGADHEIITVDQGTTEDEITTKQEHIQDGNVTVEHMYHVLEAPSKRQRLNGTGEMIFDSKYLKPNSSASAEQVPIYQDVAELCPSLQTANETKRTDHNLDTLSPPKQLSVVPVYQEISDLSTNSQHIYAQVPSA